MWDLMEAILCQFSGFRLNCSGGSRIAVDEGWKYDRIRCMPRNRTDYPEQSSRPSVILPLSDAYSACSLVPKFRCVGACCFANATDRPVLRGHACTTFCVHELPAPSVSSLRETCLCSHVNISSKLSSYPCSLQSLPRLSSHPPQSIRARQRVSSPPAQPKTCTPPYRPRAGRLARPRPQRQ